MRLASVLLLATLSLPTAAGADRAPEVTPVLGLGSGATLEPDSAGEGRAEADPSASCGLVVDFRVRPNARAEFFLDRQELEFHGEATPSRPDRFDLTIDHLHAGFVYEPRRDRVRPFVAMSLGLTRLEADGAAVGDSLSFSGSIGGGTKIAIGDRLALRLELRGYATFTDGTLQATCGPGCSVNLAADGWYQLAGRIGLAVRLGGK